jgi:hypothetical protein
MTEVLCEELLWMVPNAATHFTAVSIIMRWAGFNLCSIARVIGVMSANIVSFVWNNWASPTAISSIPVLGDLVSIFGSTIISGVLWISSIRIWTVNNVSIPFTEEAVGASFICSEGHASINSLFINRSTLYMRTGVSCITDS